MGRRVVSAEPPESADRVDGSELDRRQEDLTAGREQSFGLQ